jgi:hypothetical protein
MSEIEDFLKLGDEVDRLVKLPLFFIGGLPRSGTTWIQQLTNAHPEVFCLGESQFVGQIAGSIGRTLINHSQRRGEEDAVWAPASKGFERESVLRLLRFSFLELIRSNTGGVDLSGVKIVGEKTPENLTYIARLYGLFPGVRFIHVVRDGRDGASSAWSRFRARLPKDMSWEDYMRWYALEWSKRNLAGLKECDGDNTLVLKYEALHADPLNEAARLFAFLGVSDDPELIGKALEDASFERLSGGRKPGEVDPKSHYRRGQVGGWRTEYDERMAAVFEEVAGEALDRFGYERAVPSGR